MDVKKNAHVNNTLKGTKRVSAPNIQHLK